MDKFSARRWPRHGALGAALVALMNASRIRKWIHGVAVSSYRITALGYSRGSASLSVARSPRRCASIRLINAASLDLSGGGECAARIDPYSAADPVD